MSDEKSREPDPGGSASENAQGNLAESDSVGAKPTIGADQFPDLPKGYFGLIPILNHMFLKHIVVRTPASAAMHVMGVMVTFLYYTNFIQFYIYDAAVCCAWNDFSSFLAYAVTSVVIILTLMFYDEQPMSRTTARKWFNLGSADLATIYAFYSMVIWAMDSLSNFLCWSLAAYVVQSIQMQVQIWKHKRNRDKNGDPLLALPPGTRVKVIGSDDTIHFPYTGWGDREGVVTTMKFDASGTKHFHYTVRLDVENPCGTVLRNVVRTDIEPLEQPAPVPGAEPLKVPEDNSDDPRVKVRAAIQFCGGWGYGAQAFRLGEEMSGVEGVKLAVSKDLVMSGNFEITVGEEVLFSKQKTGAFPTATEIEQIRSVLEAKCQ